METARVALALMALITEAVMASSNASMNERFRDIMDDGRRCDILRAHPSSRACPVGDREP